MTIMTTEDGVSDQPLLHQVPQYGSRMRVAQNEDEDEAEEDYLARRAAMLAALLTPKPQGTVRKQGPSIAQLWLLLLLVFLGIMLLSALVYMQAENWTFIEALFFSVSIGYSVGIPLDLNGTAVVLVTDAAVLYTCIHALLGGLCLAAAAALLIQHVLQRDEGFVRREIERATKQTRTSAHTRTGIGTRTEGRTRASEDTHGVGGAHSDGNDPHHGGAAQRARPSSHWILRHRWCCWARRWHVAVVAAWGVALASGYLYGRFAHIPGASAHRSSPSPYALLWAVSSLTGLGAVPPNDSLGGLMFAMIFVTIGSARRAAALSPAARGPMLARPHLLLSCPYRTTHVHRPDPHPRRHRMQCAFERGLSRDDR
jgi:hypothetical protein